MMKIPTKKGEQPCKYTELSLKWKEWIKVSGVYKCSVYSRFLEQINVHNEHFHWYKHRGYQSNNVYRYHRSTLSHVSA